VPNPKKNQTFHAPCGYKPQGAVFGTACCCCSKGKYCSSSRRVPMRRLKQIFGLSRYNGSAALLQELSLGRQVVQQISTVFL